MNLTGDPWVPVVFASGESRLVSLQEAFRNAETILDLVATPPQRIALTRLLICIAQAALDGPSDETDWRSCRDRIAQAAVAYLDHNTARFGLFGDNAFLQIPNLEPTDNATLDRLDFGLAAGHNATLFDHGAKPDGRPQSEAWCALALLTYQCFSPTGTIGSSEWGGAATSRASEHAPCLEGSMLHTILRGESLLTTMHMNLLTKDIVEQGANGRWGRPVWEQMPTRPNDPEIAEITTTYLGRLVPVARGIKLTVGSTRVTLVNACSYPKLPYREPAATVVRRGEAQEPSYLAVDLSKHPWRDLVSVLASSHSSLEGGAWVLAHLESGEGAIDLWTGGLAANKAKLLDVAEWSFHLPLSLFGDSAIKKYRQGVELAERASGRLRNAVVSYLDDLAVAEFKHKDGRFTRSDPRSKAQRNKVIAKAALFYWRTLDSTYVVLLDTAADPTRGIVAGEWYGIVRDAMERAYERACPRRSARQLRAYARGWQRLTLRKPGQADANQVA